MRFVTELLGYGRSEQSKILSQLDLVLDNLAARGARVHRSGCFASRGGAYASRVFPASLFSRIARYLSERPPRPRGTRGRGDDWERLAENALSAAGYRVLARNFRTRAGEIDIVAEEKGVLCFVEVKGRSGTGFGLPAEAVTAEKRRRLFRAAQAYLRRRTPRRRAVCRFDVVTVLETGGGRRVEILRNAFEGPPPRRRRFPAC